MKSFLLLILLVSHTALFAGCPFCSKEVLDKQKVYENKSYWVLYDQGPIVQGHLLAIPKRHVVKLQELTTKEMCDFHDVVQKIAKAFQMTYQADDYFVLEKNGSKAGQSVPHVHFHFIPMKEGLDSFVKKITFMWKFLNPHKKISDEEIQQQVEILRKNMN